MKPNARATKEEIQKVFETFARTATPDDLVFVTLIGHGSYDGTDAKFNLPGPDISAKEFGALLRRLPTRQVVFVDTSSASGPFIDELSGPGRTIVTATRNGAERYATLFGGFFVDALTSEAADADKNKRVSVLEAFKYAKGEVTRAYEREGLLATEHALLDDSGDGLGVRADQFRGLTPIEKTNDGKSLDGQAAHQWHLIRNASDAALPAEVLKKRDAIEVAILQLRAKKKSMDRAAYYQELERLLVEFAELNATGTADLR